MALLPGPKIPVHLSGTDISIDVSLGPKNPKLGPPRVDGPTLGLGCGSAGSFLPGPTAVSGGKVGAASCRRRPPPGTPRSGSGAFPIKGALKTGNGPLPEAGSGMNFVPAANGAAGLAGSLPKGAAITVGCTPAACR